MSSDETERTMMSVQNGTDDNQISTAELIEKILTDKKLASSKNFQQKVYTDQPILRKASQMPGYTPQKYRDMRTIAISPEAFGKSEAWLFVQQGEFMKDYEDDFSYSGDYQRYYPTYQHMSDRELRGYFTWRTKVRKGTIEKTSRSFVFLYIYELINLIGVDSPVEGFDKLNNFRLRYREADPSIDRYSTQWLFDLVIYHGLPKELLDGVYDFSFDNALIILSSAAKRSDEEIFDALSVLSSYNICASRLYRLHPDDLRAVCCKVFKELCEYYEKRRKTGLLEKLFGTATEGYYSMFRTAVFLGRNKKQDFEYILNPIHKYNCKNGLWSSTKFPSSGKNTELGVILKAVDMTLRKALEVHPPVVENKVSKATLQIIQKTTAEYLEEKKRNQLPIVEIDISKLSGIRAASEITRERLIIDEDDFESDTSAKYSSQNTGKTNKETEANEIVSETDESLVFGETSLTREESIFLDLLINSSDYTGFLKDHGIMLSLAVDSVNEKLFDIFGDNVIDLADDKAEIISDYLPELADMKTQNKQKE